MKRLTKEHLYFIQRGCEYTDASSLVTFRFASRFFARFLKGDFVSTSSYYALKTTSREQNAADEAFENQCSMKRPVLNTGLLGTEGSEFYGKQTNRTTYEITSCRPIRSVITRVINICLITSMITDRIGQHEVLLPSNHNFNKICDV